MSEEKAKTQSKHRVGNVRIMASVVCWKKVDALIAVNGHTTHPESFRATMNKDIDRTDLSQSQKSPILPSFSAGNCRNKRC